MVTMKTTELRIGEVALTGKVSGMWNKEARSFDVKRGATANGKKYQIFEISVSSKDKDSGEWKNGKGVKVMLWGEVKVEHGQEIGIKGRFTPDNYTNKDNKEVYGNMLVAFADDLFEPAKWDAKPTEDKPKEKQEDDTPAW